MLPLFALMFPAWAWDPDAGLIPSYTEGASLSATSNESAVGAVLDGDDQSQWTSGSCLPSGFLARDDMNLLLDACDLGRCTLSGGATASGATDADFYTGAGATLSSGEASLRVSLASATLVDEIAFRGFGGPVTVEVETAAGAVVSLATYGSADAYSLRRYPAPAEAITAVVLRAAANFTTTELATYRGPCVEAVTVDLGAEQPVGVVRSRHWAGGKGLSTALYGSVDGAAWTLLAALDPEALGAVETRLPDEPSLRFLRVAHEVSPEDYAKVYVWELDAWDRDGQTGPLPAFAGARAPIAEMIGVNGIWGWGNPAYSDSLAPGQGPELYAPISPHARNYHNLGWDVTDPDHVPNYEDMATSGTEAQWWLDWDREYDDWVAAGLSVSASVQFTHSSHPMATWDDPYTAAYTYAEALARHFGPTAGTGSLGALEAGNEPWDYPADFYNAVLAGFVEGAKAGDPAITVLPCALQAHDPLAETATGGHYIGARVDEATAAQLDALNIHAYSVRNDESGVRVGVPPEHPGSSSRQVLNLLRWRNANTPGLPVWLTEWGWDSDGVGEGCSGSECVSDEAAAAYAVRGALFWNRLGLERATWFFYGNIDGCDSLFCRSGLTGTLASGFAPKRPYFALAGLRALLGELQVVGVIEESEAAWVYLLGGADGLPTHLVGWTPTDPAAGAAATVWVDLPDEPVAAFTLPGWDASGEEAPLPVREEAGLRLELSAHPLFVALRAGGGDSGEAPDTDLSDEGEGGDDGAPDTAAAPGSDSPDAPGEKGGCGCASGGGSASLGPLLALALLARRRRPTCAG
jgi:serine/threonine-protein kinase ATR